MGDDHVGFGADVIDQVTDAELAAGEGLVDVVSEARERGGGRLGLRDFAGPDDYPELVAALERLGWTGTRLDGVTHGNFLRVMRAALP